jgi:hypothetical protein
MNALARSIAVPEVSSASIVTASKAGLRERRAAQLLVAHAEVLAQALTAGRVDREGLMLHKARDLGAGERHDLPVDHLEGEHVVGEELGAMGDQMGCGRALAGAGGRGDGHDAAVDADRAGVKQAEALQGRRDREALGEQQPLREPGRTLGLRQEHLGAVGADQMNPELRRVDAVADGAILVHGEHEPPVGPASVDDPHRVRGLPATIDLLLADDPQRHGAERALSRRIR